MSNDWSVHIVGGYYTKAADSGGGLWFVFDPSGLLIGSCGSRESALLLISIIGSGGAETQGHGGGRLTAPSRAAAKITADSASPETKRAASVRPPMFEWYEPRWRRRGWRSLLERFYRYVGVRRG